MRVDFSCNDPLVQKAFGVPALSVAEFFRSQAEDRSASCLFLGRFLSAAVASVYHLSACRLSRNRHFGGYRDPLRNCIQCMKVHQLASPSRRIESSSENNSETDETKW